MAHEVKKVANSSRGNAWMAVSFAVPWVAIIAFLMMRDADRNGPNLVPHDYLNAKPNDLNDSVARKQAIDQAARYLVQATQRSGRYDYIRDLQYDELRTSDYNVLRHAGAMYALATYHHHTPTPQSAAALQRAKRYLVENCVAPLPEDREIWGVWSTPEVTGSPTRLLKLGAVGLTLIAFSQIEISGIDPFDREMLTRIGDCALLMQQPDGSFVSKIVPSRPDSDDEWVSLYYPGEAALGLVMAGELTGEARWTQAAEKALLYLARSRQNQTEVPADHWALLATARLFDATSHRGDVSETTLDSDARVLLQQHAAQICRQMLLEWNDVPVDSPAHGSFTLDGRTTPTATRLEGLQAALVVLPAESSDLIQEIQTCVEKSTQWLVACQIENGPLLGAFPRAMGTRPRREGNETSEDWLEFNRRATEIRIDYVQHALSALMQYNERAIHRAVND